MFVRGNVDTEKETFTQDDEDNVDGVTFSKEARVAMMYRGDILYPFNLTIIQENRQQAKIMSPKKQIILRVEERKKRKEKSVRIEKKHYEDKEAIFCKNKECEELLNIREP